MDAATVFADSTARVVLQVCGGGLVMDLDLLDSGDTERTAFVWVGAGGGGCFGDYDDRVRDIPGTCKYHAGKCGGGGGGVA